MSPLAALAIFAAGLAAGTVNVIVGSGSLITFPTLLALGYPPVLANVSNTVGLVPGSMSAVAAYRRELTGQRSRLLKLGSASLAGSLVGATLLLALPHDVFKAAVPALIALASVLMAVQPRMSRRLEARGTRRLHGGAPLLVGIFLTGMYGGYFGAAQGVILIALLAIFIDDELQRLNGTKNALALTANLVAGLLFVATTDISWSVAGLIAAGSIIGGQVGGHIGRRLPAPVLRWTIVVVGLGVAVGLAVEWH
ncbi:MAG TPA: sulfite exporter TauE/SafE family protein [Acidimicrobiales bacterium]|nr:sulfite exporter TauE/SafE family protein [Acidimicrobiales bacterium]